jgi:AraC family transcriptional regulator of arabinose operon
MELNLSMNVSVFPILTDADQKLPFYMTSAGEWDNQEPVVRNQGFPDVQWIQCMRGRGELWLNDRCYVIGEGQGMLLFPNSHHRYYASIEPWTVRWVSFNGHYAEGLLSSLQFTHSQMLYISNPDALLEKLHEATVKLNSNNPLKSLDCSSLVYEIMLDLYKYSSPTEARFKHQDYDQMFPVFNYIEKHYNEVITLQQLSEQISVTPQHTCLLFQQTMGIRPFEYITKFRLRKAKEMLLQDMRMPIGEISRNVGFEHPSYFIKLFKSNEGTTPAIFRKNHRTSI